MQNLFDSISSLSDDGQRTAWKALANNAAFRTVGLLRSGMRQAPVRDEELVTSVDNRNDQDIEIEGNTPYGFDERESPALRASHMHAVYVWAKSEAMTHRQNRYDEPMDVSQVLEFMVTRSSRVGQDVLSFIAEELDTSLENIKQMKEVQEQQERDELIANTPALINEFMGFGDVTSEDSLNAIDKVTQHQMGVSVCNKIVGARDRIVTSMLSTGRLRNMGLARVLKADAVALKASMLAFEKKYSKEFDLAIELGREFIPAEDIQID